MADTCTENDKASIATILCVYAAVAGKQTGLGLHITEYRLSQSQQNTVHSVRDNRLWYFSPRFSKIVQVIIVCGLWLYHPALP